jgi:hypothetical protein
MLIVGEFLGLSERNSNLFKDKASRGYCTAKKGIIVSKY